MFRSMTVRNFRGFNSLSVDGFSQLNFVTGRNGSGKTAFLEALFLNSGPGNAGLALSLENFRGDEVISMKSERCFRSLFHRLKLSEPATIQTTWRPPSQKADARRSLTIRPLITTELSRTSSTPAEVVNGIEFEYSSNATKKAIATLKWEETPQPIAAQAGPLSTEQRNYRLAIGNHDLVDHIDGRFIIASHHNVLPSMHTHLTQLAKERKIGEVVRLLQTIDSRIRDILPLTENGENVIFFDVGYDELMPIFLMGEGAFNATNLSCNFATMKRGVVLIDEIENGLHYSLYESVVEFVVSAIRGTPIQVFVTTHSDDFISKATKVCSRLGFSDVSAFRFTPNGGLSSVTHFDFQDLINSSEMPLELR